MMAGTYRSSGNNVARSISSAFRGKRNEKKAKARMDYAHSQSLERVRVSGHEARKTYRTKAEAASTVVMAKAKGKVKVENARTRGKVKVIEKRAEVSGKSKKKGTPTRKRVSKDNKW